MAAETRARQQPSMLAVGTVVWLASELMFFGGLFAAYFTLKAEARVWPPAGVELETALSAIFTLFLIASSGTMVLAVRSLERGDRAGMIRWLLLTLGLGALFLANQIREFYTLDFQVSSNSYGSIYYLMTGFHALHVAAGLLLMLVALAIATGPGPVARRAPVVDSIGYYWHFVDVVWIGLFTTIFVIR
ncbi:MAG TPA: heme-copper oxidase subunit III [Acidimicrobiia bacterium]|nr:heme-copper oxidase subunit III [Acidimicrobiia bacterium]